MTFDPNTAQFVRRVDGEAVELDFTLDESAVGWGLRAAVAATEAATHLGGIPLIAYLDPPNLLVSSDGFTITVILTAADTGTALGRGRWHVGLWRTDSGQESRLGWVILDLGGGM